MDEKRRISPASVDDLNIAEGAVGSREIAEGAVGAEHLAPGAVDSSALADKSLYADKIGDGVVEEPAIRDGSVTHHHIRENSIQTRHIGEDAILGRNIADSEISGRHIGAEQITSEHLQDEAVTAFKIGSNQVLDTHINSVLASKIDYRGNPIIPGGTPGQVLTRTSSGIGMEWRDPLSSQWEVINTGYPGTIINRTTPFTFQFPTARTASSYSLILIAFTPPGFLYPGYIPVEFLRQFSQSNPYITPGQFKIWLGNNTMSLQFDRDSRVFLNQFPFSVGWHSIYARRA